ncbi:MAG: hypothetical protein UV29_C0016G0045, partial [Candidatus Collierbacteria bacterium GW2011_GWD2_42_50]
RTDGYAGLGDGDTNGGGGKGVCESIGERQIIE